MLRSREEKTYTAISHIILMLCSIAALLPFIIMFSASISENTLIIRDGYGVLPKGFSLEAYSYILNSFETVGRSYFVTIFTTIVGVSCSVVITVLCAYALSQDDLPGVNILMFLVIFTMLFNGGLVPAYYVYTKILHVKNTFIALVVPNLMFGTFQMILVRNYFKQNIPRSIIDAARIDGSSELNTFLRVVLPISKPILATIALLSTVNYWNDWQNGLYYVDDSRFFSIQQVLRTMSTNVSFLSSTGMSVNVGRNLPTATIRMAIAFVAILPILVVYPFFQSYFVRGIAVGAVKE